MSNKNYLIIPASEVKKVNFDEIMEHSVRTLNFSGDGKKTFIKWIGEEPSFVSSIKNSEGPYSNEEILKIIRHDDWISPKSKKSVKKVT